MNLVEDFRSAMARAGLSYSSLIIPDGKLHRFNSADSKGEASWYVLYLHDDKFAAGVFGDWRSGLKEKWNSSNGSNLSPEERRELSRKMAEANAVHKTEEEKLVAAAKLKSAQILSAATVPKSHPYLDLKKCGVHGELRCTSDSLLVLPLRDVSGSLQTLQLIAPDNRFPGGRDKSFLLGGTTKAAFFTVSDRSDGPLVICEGYATGATIHEATGWATVCAMYAGNLLPVAKALRSMWNDRTIILASDNDRFTKDNPGLKQAVEASKAVKGILATPEFADEDLKGTDFNDVSLVSGLNAVQSLFQRCIRSSSDWTLLLEDSSESVLADIPEPIQIIAGLITEQSKVVIGGGSKTFKSWLSIQLSVCCALGIDFLSRHCLQQRVLYVNLELKPRTFKRRVQAIVRSLGVSFPPGLMTELHLRGRIAGLKKEEIMDRIIAAARSFSATIVVLDPIYKLNTEGDELTLPETRLSSLTNLTASRPKPTPVSSLTTTSPKVISPKKTPWMPSVALPLKAATWTLLSSSAPIPNPTPSA